VRFLLPLHIVDGETYTIIAYRADEIATDIGHSINDRSVVEEFQR
jgi:hypothetical protein